MKLFTFIVTLIVSLSFSGQLSSDEYDDAQADNTYYSKIAKMNQYRLNTERHTDKVLLNQAVFNTGTQLLDQCIDGSRISCIKLMNFILQNKKADPLTKCYAIMIAGYTCDQYKDIPSCGIYKLNKEYCKNLKSTTHP